MFNILGWEFIEGAAVLDLFAGTGAFALEALSRGAREAVLVDNSSISLDLIRKNIAVCGFSAKAHVVRHDLLKSLFFWRKLGLERSSTGGLQAPVFDLIFLDPPYRQGQGERLLSALLAEGLVGERTTVVFEDDSAESLPEAVGVLLCYDRRSYGDTGFWLYEKGIAGPDDKEIHA